MPRCAKLPGRGKRCNPHDEPACAATLACDPQTLKCLNGPGLEEACPLGGCPERSICEPNVTLCYPLPGPDEYCGAFECITGFVCQSETDRCVEAPPLVCALAGTIDFCAYAHDDLCDEPEGTGLCPEHTDVADCETDAASSPVTTDLGPWRLRLACRAAPALS